MRIENLAGEVIDSDENSSKSSSESPSPHSLKKSSLKSDASSLFQKTSKNHNFPKIGSQPDNPNSSAYSTSEPIITDIKQGLKNPNRANIFVNGKFSFSLDISQIVDL